MDDSDTIRELRSLILRAAPDEEQARPIEACSEDQRLDEVIPFSSLILLGTVVAIEDRYRIEVTRDDLERATEGGLCLRQLARLVRRAVETSTGPPREAGSCSS